VNCGSSSEGLLELTLFGEKKTPFAASSDETVGVFHEAAGGTVLVEGIECLSLALQARLLKLLQERPLACPEPAGATPIDARILAASNEALEPRITAQTFRGDLFQHLSATVISLPRLRDRLDDIPLLVSHFLQGKVHRRDGKPFVFAHGAIEACCAYGWPGEVSELRQAVERACAAAEDSNVQVSDLPLAVQRLASGAESEGGAGAGRNLADLTVGVTLPGSARGTQTQVLSVASVGAELVPLKQFLRDQELSYLHRTLGHVGGSKERAAELLGISLATMYRKLAEPDAV
jgi:DNA-binding NtrC family response regulator